MKGLPLWAIVTLINLLGAAWFMAGQLEERSSPGWANAVVRAFVVFVAIVAGALLPLLELVWTLRDRRRIRRNRRRARS